jgi:hypothetical protein
MMVVSTTGHIISSLGPYFSDGKNNDANIQLTVEYGVELFHLLLCD